MFWYLYFSTGVLVDPHYGLKAIIESAIKYVNKQIAIESGSVVIEAIYPRHSLSDNTDIHLVSTGKGLVSWFILL